MTMPWRIANGMARCILAGRSGYRRRRSGRMPHRGRNINYTLEGELFTSDAEEEIYKISGGIPRMINRACEKCLMYAYQQQKRMVDGHMVRYVAEHEMLQTEAMNI